MKSVFTSIVLVCILLVGCNKNSPNEHSIATSTSIIDYLNAQPQDSMPQLFLPQLVSTAQHEHNGIIAPDLKHFYYTVSDTNFANFTIKVLAYENGMWSQPKTAAFSGEYTDHAVSFSGDGNRMYLSSTRPQINLIDWDIWFLSLSTEGWSEPQKMDSVINTKMLESHASLSSANNLYFHANYEKGGYFSDIYFSKYTNGIYATPIKLSGAINTDLIEVTPYISPDEQYLIYTAYGYPNSFGDGDLYISFKGASGNWLKGINMGKTINTKFEESNPYVSPNGKFLFFSSTRESLIGQHAEDKLPSKSMDVYWINTAVIEKLRDQVLDQ